MIDIDFVKGINRDRLAKSLKKAGIRHRFAVIQHREAESGNGKIDARLFWALIDFVSDYDRAASLFYIEDEADIGVNERPIQALIEQWKAAPTERRYLPAAFLLRNGRVLRLCLTCESYGVGDHWPFNDSNTFALLSDRDVSQSVLSHLRGHEYASAWRLSPRVADIKETGRYLPMRNRSRENTAIPRRGRGPLWMALALAALTVISLGLMATSVRTMADVPVYVLSVIAWSAFLASILFLSYRDLDVSLGWDGIRKGKGPGLQFIAWDDARVNFRGGHVVVRSKTQTISLSREHFNETQFGVFFHLIRREIEARGLSRADAGEQITTPAYALSATDLKTFYKYRGKGSGKSILSDLQPFSFPVFCVGIAAALLWFSPRRPGLPQVLQYPLVFIAVACLCAALVCAAIYLGGRLFIHETPASDPADVTLSLTEVGLVTQDNRNRHLLFWDEIRWIVQTPVFILFVSRDGLASLLPKRVFASPAEAAAFFDRAVALKQAYVE